VWLLRRDSERVYRSAILSVVFAVTSGHLDIWTSGPEPSFGRGFGLFPLPLALSELLGKACACVRVKAKLCVCLHLTLVVWPCCSNSNTAFTPDCHCHCCLAKLNIFSVSASAMSVPAVPLSLLSAACFNVFIPLTIPCTLWNGQPAFALCTP
jgi:hypothetical protein